VNFYDQDVSHVCSTADVKRWDIYDIADHLEDLPGMLSRATEGQPWNRELEEAIGAVHYIALLAFQASTKGGSVAPWPYTS
jgi:hypothetical protein